MSNQAVETPTAQAAGVPAGFERIACPMCGSDRSSVVMKGPDRVLGRPEELAVVRCDGCGLCFVNPRPLVGRLADYYPEDYEAYQELGAEARASSASTKLRRLALRRMYARSENRPSGPTGVLAGALVALRGPEHFGDGVRVHGGGRLLDVGCGQGKLLRQMKSVGWEVVGVDFSERAVEAARRIGLEVHLGSLPHPQIPPASVDAVVMQHSLEHVPDPLATLGAALEALRPGGVLRVQVPNFASWEVKRFGEVAQQVQLPRHLLHFEPATLADLLRRAGFEDIEVAARPRRGFIRKSIRAARQAGQAVPTWMQWSLAHRLIAHRSARRGDGGELVATARRPG